MKDTILSLSGGLDSSSLLFEFRDRIKLAVSFKYGSNHQDKELAAAKKVVEEVNKLGANIEHRIIDLTNTFKTFKSALLSGADAVPNAEYNEETIADLVVPFRNGIFLSILAGIADSVGVYKIALAAHSGDHCVYPDCRPEFSDAIEKAIQLGTSRNVEFFRPYINISKADIASRGVNAGLNPDWTYSCYKGGDKPCGECPTCVERTESLKGLKW